MEYRPDELARELRELKDQVRSLLSQAVVGYSSVSDGALEIRSEEGLIVDGSALVTGLLRVVGRLIVEGLGILEVASLIDLSGMLRVLGEIVVDSGKITAGGVRIEDGRIYVGEGASQIIIDGATGRITAGNLTIDPTIAGGAVAFQNGAQVFTDAATVQVFLGNSVVQISNDYARLQHGGYVIEIDGNGARISPGAVPEISGTGAPAGVAFFDANGYFLRADGS